MKKLLLKDIIKNLEKVRGWKLERNKIVREFIFNNFIESISFVNKIAEAAEKEQHHPDISIRYNKVKIILSTHSVNGVTDKDFRLAKLIDGLS